MYPGCRRGDTFGCNITLTFGIGLPKTGTKSLYTACRIAGGKGEHHDPMLKGLSIRYDGCQFAIIVMPQDFKIIDELFYYKAKFIYTEREQLSWLYSIDQHYNKSNREISKHNAAFGYWRHKLFGANNPSAQQFIETRRKHESEVEAYFSDKQDRMLRMDICGGDGWEKLCPFLGVPIPEVEFPHVNVGQYK